MTQVVDRQARIEARARDKFQAKRDELAMATLTTLAELGYARTSLREIAQNSEYSHGVLHYYFTDKLDLIAHAVRQYEAVCVTRYDEVVAQAVTADQLRDEFAEIDTRELFETALADGVAFIPGPALDEMLADIRRRDERDAGRGAAPMVQAQDAALLDTTDMGIEAAFDAARRIVEAARARHGL